MTEAEKIYAKQQKIQEIYIATLSAFLKKIPDKKIDIYINSSYKCNAEKSITSLEEEFKSYVLCVDFVLYVYDDNFENIFYLSYFEDYANDISVITEIIDFIKDKAYQNKNIYNYSSYNKKFSSLFIKANVFSILKSFYLGSCQPVGHLNTIKGEEN